jgi:MFS family permease
MSGNIATASAAVADFTSQRDRAKGMGVLGAAFGLGFILGPAIGAFSSRLNLLEPFPSWERFGVNPFSVAALVAGLLSVVNVLWVATRFQETLTPQNRERARQGRRPINPLVLFRPLGIAGVHRTNLVYFLFIAAFSGLEFTLTFFAKERFAYTHETMWTIFVYVGVLIALVQGGIVRRVAPRFGERRVAAFGLLTLVPAFVLITFSADKTMLFAGLGVMAVGSALATPCLTALTSLYTPEDRQGSVLGIFRSLGALARAVGPIAFGVVYWKFGANVAYLAGAALLVLPFLIALGLPEPRRDEG